MKDQRKIWDNEHLSPQTFVRLHGDKPSTPLSAFLQFLLKYYHPGEITLVDIGTGKGRNAVFAASLGVGEVIGIDFSFTAIKEARQRAKRKGLTNVQFRVVDLDKKWPFNDESVTAIIDCNTTICIPIPGRTKAIEEARRVLVPGGYYLFYGVGKTDFVNKSPGPEQNSAIFEKTGKFEKQYDKNELLSSYDAFVVEDLKEIIGQDKVEGKNMTYSMWVARFKKE